MAPDRHRLAVLLIRLGTVYINHIAKELTVVTDRPQPPNQPPFTARLRVVDLPRDGDRVVVFDKFKGNPAGLNLAEVKKELHADSVLVFTGVIDLDDC